MKNINKIYKFDLNDCVWDITFKCTIKNQLTKIMNELLPPARDLTHSIDKFIQYKVVE